MFRRILYLSASVAAAALVAGCGGSATQTAAYGEEYLKRLPAAGSNHSIGVLPPPEHVERFRAFLDAFDEATISREATKIYASNAYLNDSVTTARGNAQIRDYLLEAVRQNKIETEVLDVAKGGRGWYFSWKMVVQNKTLNGGKPFTSIGITHAIFNTVGRIQTHQDFWDSGSFLLGQVPVLGSLNEAVLPD